jgi:uncharacterized protein (DUF427 family)
MSASSVVRGLSDALDPRYRAHADAAGTADYFNYTKDDGEVIKDIAWCVARASDLLCCLPSQARN